MSEREAIQAYLALGSNLGDRAALIQDAVTRLNDVPGIQVLEMSCLYETEPVGMAESGAEWFANAAVAIETTLSPQALLEACLSVERQLGRERATLNDLPEASGYQSRTLDIDILFSGNQVLQHGLTQDDWEAQPDRCLRQNPGTDTGLQGPSALHNTEGSRDLQIPHPRLHERAFVLVPMLELAPEFQHPVLQKTIQELHLALPHPEEVLLFGTRNALQNA